MKLCVGQGRGSSRGSMGVVKSNVVWSTIAKGVGSTVGVDGGLSSGGWVFNGLGGAVRWRGRREARAKGKRKGKKGKIII